MTKAFQKSILIKKATVFLIAFSLVFSTLTIGVLTSASTDTYTTLYDFEESTTVGSYVTTLSDHARVSINTDTANVNSGSQSLYIDNAGDFPRVAISGEAGDFNGDGFRFYVKNPSGYWYGLYVLTADDDRVLVDFDTNWWNHSISEGWVTINYAEVSALAEVSPADIIGIELRFYQGKGYIDDVEILNKVIEVEENTYTTLYDFEDMTNLGSNIVETRHGNFTINTDSAYVNSGSQSIKFTQSASWAAITLKGINGDFNGDGFRFNIKTADGSSVRFQALPQEDDEDHGGRKDFPASSGLPQCRRSARRRSDLEGPRRKV